MSTDRDVSLLHKYPDTNMSAQAKAPQEMTAQAAFSVSLPSREDRRPRRLSAQACAADNLLSHSIEYLTDARKLPNGRVGRLSPDQPDVQAVMVLMGARHDVYMACPIIERRSKTRLFGMFKGPDRRDR